MQAHSDSVSAAFRRRQQRCGSSQFQDLQRNSVKPFFGHRFVIGLRVDGK